MKNAVSSRLVLVDSSIAWRSALVIGQINEYPHALASEWNESMSNAGIFCTRSWFLISPGLNLLGCQGRIQPLPWILLQVPPGQIFRSLAHSCFDNNSSSRACRWMSQAEYTAWGLFEWYGGCITCVSSLCYCSSFWWVFWERYMSLVTPSVQSTRYSCSVNRGFDMSPNQKK